MMEDLPNGPEEQQEFSETEEPWTERVLSRLNGWWTQLVDAWQDWRANRPQAPTVDQEEIARWIALLSHPNDPQHTRAMDELVVIGKPAVPALLEALRSDTWIQVFRASEALGLMGERRAVWPLLRLLNHPNSNVRWGAAESLGRLRSRWARRRLRRVVLEDENRTSWGETVAEAAERAVASIDRTWVSRLITLFQVLFLLAACVVIVYYTIQFVQEGLSHRVQRTPEPTIAPSVTPTETIPPTPSPTPLPDFIPLGGTITGGIANVRSLPDSENGEIIGVLHYGDQVSVYGGATDTVGDWWYLIRLTRINNPATSSEVLEAGSYGWLHASLVAGTDTTQIGPTVGALETMRAGAATPTPIQDSRDLFTPTPPMTTTAPMAP
ncbi:MAG: HEAT repeat domain-containing protein [Chloroflexia bacterium]|nr:HEAT repeat domain-containing protein [Chloroflexia bacterium]